MQRAARRRLLALSAALPGLAALPALVADPARAQVAAVDVGGGFVAVTPGLLSFSQSGPAGNAIAVVQSGGTPVVTLAQSGFYNRAVAVEVGTATSATVTQFGNFSRAVVVQVSPSNTANVTQTGDNGAAIVDQSATSRLSGASLPVLAAFATNLLVAPEAAAALPRLGERAVQGLAPSLFGRLDAGRRTVCAAPDPAGLLGCRVSLFLDGTVEHGSRDAVLGAGGLGYTTGRLTGGASLEVAPGLVAGPIVDASHSGATLDGGLGGARLDAVEVGAFASYARLGVFAHAVAAYGFDRYRTERPGFGAPVGADPSGNSVLAAAKGGYLHDFGALQAGPVAGLLFSRAGIDRYVETGDPLLTQSVGAQASRDLIADAGLRLRAPVTVGSVALSPFLDLLAEHEHSLDGARTIDTAFSIAPAQRFMTPVRAPDETYGKVGGGVGLGAASGMALTLSADTTFARASGNAFAFDASLSVGF